MNNKNKIIITREMNADEKLREQAYYREKQLHDEVSFIESAKRTGRAEGRNEREKEIVARMKAKGYTAEQIAAIMEDQD